MKVAGLTWWRGNYGSILQAYALQELINTYTDVEYEILDQYGEMASAGNLFDKLKRWGIKKTLKKIRWKFASVGFSARNAALQKFVEDRLHLSKKRYTAETIKESLKEYDGYICGSDQVWNPILSDVNDIYWLGFAGSEKVKVAYAPSIGVTECDAETAATIRKNLADYDGISCREQPGSNFLNHILGANLCKTVLDPTLALPREKWDAILPAPKVAPNTKYVFAYILRGDKAQRQLVERYAKKHGLMVVTFPYLDSDYIEKYDKKFGDKRIYDASPTDFIQLIKDAEYVFTDSFHCTVFSILYHKLYCLLPKVGKTQNLRLLDLQQKFQIEDRMIIDNELSTVERLKPIDWKIVDERLNELRKESISYLVNALEKRKI